MKKSIFFSLLIPVFFAVSCNDDEGSDGTPLTADQAQTSMDNLANNMSDDVVNLVQSEGVEAMNDLFGLLDLNDPFNGRLAELDHEGRRKWFKSRTMLFKTIFVPAGSVDFNRVQESDFDFDGNKGIYNWNPEIEEFEKSQETSDMIVINFPADGSTTNNVTLRIKEYTEEAIEEEDEFFPGEIDIFYVPTRLSADLSVDGVVQVSLDFTAAYNSVGDPVSGNGSLFINPYTFTVNFDDTQSATSTLSASITEGDNVITSADLTVVFQTADKEDVKEASGFVQYLNIKVQGTIDAVGLESDDEDIDVNDFVNLELFDGANKVGDIVFEIEEDEDGYEEEVPYVVYSDGSKEKLEDVLQSVVDEVEGEFDDWDFGD